MSNFDKFLAVMVTCLVLTVFAMLADFLRWHA
jgi:preprotein translocase subunit SecE